MGSGHVVRTALRSMSHEDVNASPGLQSGGPPMSFSCGLHLYHMVSVITKEEDSYKCVTTSLLQNPITNLPALPGSEGGEERLQAGHGDLSWPLKESLSPEGSGLRRDGKVRDKGQQGSAHPSPPGLRVSVLQGWPCNSYSCCRQKSES